MVRTFEPHWPIPAPSFVPAGACGILKTCAKRSIKIYLHSRCGRVDLCYAKADFQLGKANSGEMLLLVE